MHSLLHLRELSNARAYTQLPAQVVNSKVAMLLRAHFSNDIAETAAQEPILFGALQKSKVLNVTSQIFFLCSASM